MAHGGEISYCNFGQAAMYFALENLALSSAMQRREPSARQRSGLRAAGREAQAGDRDGARSLGRAV